MATLREEQNIFSRDLVKLLTFLFEHGYEVSIGEVFRTPEQQKIYVDTGRSKTLYSNHLKKCAADLAIFKDGKLLTSKEELQFVGDAWEVMSAKNSWGGNWKSFKDLPHFERRV